MRIKLIASTALATMTLAASSFADNTGASTTVAAPGAPSTTIAPGTSAGTGTGTGTTAGTTAGTTVMAPAPTAPMAPAGAAANPYAPTTTAPAPVSTTTTTGADAGYASNTYSTSSNADRTTLFSKRTPNRPLLVTGGLVLVATYATTAAVTAAEGSTRDHDLYIPVAGPWINLASRDTNVPNNTRDTALIVGSGILQGAGAAAAIASFFIPEKIATATIATGPVKMHVTPSAAAGAGGMMAFGTF